MKKTFILTAVVLLFSSAVVFAEESVLIDFAKLDANILPNKEGVMTQNRQTIMDFSSVAGSSYTADQKALLRSSLALGQWEVVLNSSSQNPTTLGVSHTIEAPVLETSKQYAGQKLLGVRADFPEWAHNANATIQPPFAIPAYEVLSKVDDNGNIQPPTAEEKASGKTRFENGYGVVKNVGVIKQIAVDTYGMNFPHALYVLIRDQNNEVHRYYMGRLLFDGWKQLVWNNPAYITDVKARELRVYPVYPSDIPFVVFQGLYVVRDAMNAGGNYIGYFKDVKLIYDKASLNTMRDFADENLWGIQTQRDKERMQIESARFGEQQLLRYLEKEKMATENGFSTNTDTQPVAAPAANNNSGNAAGGRQ